MQSLKHRASATPDNRRETKKLEQHLVLLMHVEEGSVLMLSGFIYIQFYKIRNLGGLAPHIAVRL